MIVKIVKKIWKKGRDYEYTGYFLFGFIPLYIYIEDYNAEN